MKRKKKKRKLTLGQKIHKFFFGGSTKEKSIKHRADRRAAEYTEAWKRTPEAIALRKAKPHLFD